MNEKYKKIKSFLSKNILLVLAILILINFMVLISAVAYQFYFNQKVLDKQEYLVDRQDAVYKSLSRYSDLAPTPINIDITKPDSKKDRWMGNTKTDWVLISYTDLECPYCASFHPILEEVVKKDKTLGLVVRHLPIENIHPNAFDLAVVSECVAEKNGDKKFFEFVDSVFASETSLENVVESGWLNQEDFDKCQKNSKIVEKVEANFKEAVDNGINSTPTTVLYHMPSGKNILLVGTLDADGLKKAIKEFKEKRF